MKARYVKEGQEVKQGQHLGTMGNLGNSYGQHLHFEVRQNGSKTDPVPFLNDSIWNGTPTAGSHNSTSISSTSSSSTSDLDTTNIDTKLRETYRVQLRNFNQIPMGMGDGGKITQGLSDIKETLIALSNKQTQDQQIMSMLSGKQKPTPKIN